VLRTLLVPALMHLLGRANWWLPGWLERALPRLSIEPPETEAVPEPPKALQPPQALRPKAPGTA
jgi:RND superfamily putative drug exporter